VNAFLVKSLDNNSSSLGIRRVIIVVLTLSNRPFAGLGHVVQRDKQISSDDKMIDIIRKSTLKLVFMPSSSVS
jgi:hypothetical protein